MTNEPFKDIKLSNQSFTTNRKTPKSSIDISRKGSIVKERCKQLTVIINDLFPSQIISDRDLADLIEEYIGADKETLRSYKGYGGSVRMGRAGDNKIVGLSRKGYLERFGFLTRVHRSWVVSQALLSSQSVVKAVSGYDSNQNLSISTAGMGVEGLGVKNGSSRELEEEEDRERDRNVYPKICPKIPELGPLELSILTAGPSKETNRAKVDWGSA